MTIFSAEDMAKVTKNFLIAIGAEIQSGTNNIIDQETKSALSFEGKFIKANTDPSKALYVSDNDIKLDPLDPKCTKLIERIFAKFLKDSEEMGNIEECVVYYFDKEEEEKDKETIRKYRLSIKFTSGNVWVGNWYLNKIICFDEAIFSLDGTFAEMDLRFFDVDQSEWSE